MQYGEGRREIQHIHDAWYMLVVMRLTLKFEIFNSSYIICSVQIQVNRQLLNETEIEIHLVIYYFYL